MSIYQEIIHRSETMLPELQIMRRDFHRHPEQAWLEIRTASSIAQALDSLGYEVLAGREVCQDSARMSLPSQTDLDAAYDRAIRQGAPRPWADLVRDGFTGVMGTLRCGPGPVIAMRFDMDALPITEADDQDHQPVREDFRSLNEGVSHACGHDGHVTIGLGTARLLAELKDRLHGTIKLIFQPAEEGVTGARAIVAHGHLDDVDYILGNHMGTNDGGTAQICLPLGATMATNKSNAVFTGKSAHAGSVPEQGHNAMLAAATAVLNLYAISRCSTGDTRVNVGVLRAGTARNAICDHAELQFEVRGSTTEANDYMYSRAVQILRSAAEMHDCTCEITLAGIADALRSTPTLAQRCADLCRDRLGLEPVLPTEDDGICEDYSLMVNRVTEHGGQGLFFRTLSHCNAPLHARNFDFREDCLPHSIQVFCAMACELMGL